MRNALFAAVSAAVLAAALLVSGSAAFAADPAPAPASDKYGAWGVDLTAGDHSVNPGDNFWRYADGHWADFTTIPADQGGTGTGSDVFNRTQAQLRQVIEDAAKHPDSPAAAQIGALYSAFMDEARVEALDDKPLRPDLADIAAIKTRAEFTRLMGRSEWAITPVGLSSNPDPKHPEVNILWVNEAGLGLPDRDYYLEDSFKPQRDAYRAYIVRTFQLIGYADPEKSADAVMAFETAIAKASWPVADRRDIDKINNPMSIAELQAYAPGLDWAAFIEASGAGDRTRALVAEKTAIKAITDLYAETPLDTLKAWQAFHTTDQAAPYLSKRFVDNTFEFNKALSGVTTLRPRWKRAVSQIDSSLGEELGQVYVAKYFPPEAKAKMQMLVANLKTAMAGRIRASSWMSDNTKAEALKKLDKMSVQIGYPDKFRDYSGLKIDAGDLYGDMRRSLRFEQDYQFADLDKPVDHHKWAMTPQTVDAYNGGLENKIVFPAGILQAPLFSANADDAVNYGAIGAVIGHEITHGFDDQGRKIDSTGALRDWWTDEDGKRFDAEAAKFGAQYDTYEPVPGAHINGKLTMGENIADMGGLLAALDAYHASLGGQPAPVIGGLTGDQRLFLAFAGSWRIKMRNETLRDMAVSDVHSPPRFRVNGVVRNIDAWYSSFNVKPAMQLYLKPDARVHLW